MSYELKVTIDIPSAIDLHVKILIIIGNVQFEGGEFAPVSINTTRDSYPPPAGIDPCPPGGLSFKYSSVHPPVIIGLNRYTMGETQYVPVYFFVTNYQFASRLS